MRKSDQSNQKLISLPFNRPGEFEFTHWLSLYGSTFSWSWIVSPTALKGLSHAKFGLWSFVKKTLLTVVRWPPTLFAICCFAQRQPWECWSRPSLCQIESKFLIIFLPIVESRVTFSCMKNTTVLKRHKLYFTKVCNILVNKGVPLFCVNLCKNLRKVRFYNPIFGICAHHVLIMNRCVILRSGFQ